MMRDPESLTRPPGRLLVRLPNWLGDVAMATPVLRTLRHAYPRAHIAYLLKPYLAELLAGCGWFDELLLPGAEPESMTGLNVPCSSVSTLRPKMALQLARKRFDTALLLPNSFGALVPLFLAGIPRRIGYSRYLRGFMLTRALSSPRDDSGLVLPEPMTPYYGRLLEAFGLQGMDLTLSLPYEHALESELDRVLYQEQGLDRDLPILCCHPGASYGSAKCWPPEFFARLGDLILEQYRVNLVFTLGPAELDMEQRIGSGMQRTAVFLKLSLRLMLPLFRRIRLLITNDTGPRHIAVAMDRPMIAFFGPSDIRYTRFHMEKTVVLRREELPCLPCCRRVCPLGHHDCMKLIRPEEVFGHLQRLMKEPGNGRPGLPSNPSSR